MTHLRRRTTAFLAVLVGTSQLAAALGFFWHMLGLMEVAGSGSESILAAAHSSVAYTITLGRVYFGALAGGLVLSAFAAPGLKLWCLLLVGLLTALSFPVFVLAGAQLGA